MERVANVEHQVRLGIAEILQRVTRGARGEIAKIEGIVNRPEVIVKQPGWAAGQQALDLVVDHRMPRSSGDARFAQHFQKRARLLDAFGGIGVIARVVQHHLTQHDPNVPAWQRVVADEGDSLRRQAIAAETQQTLANVVGHPGVDAMRDDVIEFAESRAGLSQIQHAQVEIGEPEFTYGAATLGDGRLRQVDAGKLAAGQRVRHRNQVGGISAAHFQNAAGGDRRGSHSE